MEPDWTGASSSAPANTLAYSVRNDSGRAIYVGFNPYAEPVRCAKLESLSKLRIELFLVCFRRVLHSARFGFASFPVRCPRLESFESFLVCCLTAHLPLR